MTQTGEHVEEGAQIAVAPAEQPAAPAEQPESLPDYDLHIKVPGELRAQLKDAAELAFLLEKTPKADLVDLMNLFIVWGFAILKQSYQERKGYR